VAGAFRLPLDVADALAVRVLAAVAYERVRAAVDGVADAGDDCDGA